MPGREDWRPPDSEGVAFQLSQGEPQGLFSFLGDLQVWFSPSGSSWLAASLSFFPSQEASPCCMQKSPHPLRQCRGDGRVDQFRSHARFQWKSLEVGRVCRGPMGQSPRQESEPQGCHVPPAIKNPRSRELQLMGTGPAPWGKLGFSLQDVQSWGSRETAECPSCLVQEIYFFSSFIFFSLSFQKQARSSRQPGCCMFYFCL